MQVAGDFSSIKNCQFQLHSSVLCAKLANLPDQDMCESSNLITLHLLPIPAPVFLIRVKIPLLLLHDLDHHNDWLNFEQRCFTLTHLISTEQIKFTPVIMSSE